MRNGIFATAFVLVCSLVSATTVEAQGSRKPPKTGASNLPSRPGAQRGAAAEQEPEASQPQRPSSRFNSAPTEPETQEPELIEDRRGEGGSRPPGRFDSRDGAASDPAPEADEAAPAREPFRSAGLEDRTKARGTPNSRQLLEETPESSDQNAETEPAPLANRGGAQSVEAQSIQVKLNDSHAGVSLAYALNLEHGGAITGYPIQLEQVLSASPDATARRAAIRAYWNLVISIADHHHALDEFDRATQLSESSRDKLAEAAAAAAEARVAETKIIVTAAQFDLASFTPSPATLPIPADAPLVSEYRTEFAALFGRGPAPLAIKRLSVMLPLYKDQVLARGRAAYAASEALDASGDLQTFRQLCEHRRAFLGAVRDYNEAIADYALQLTTPGMSAETVTSMLIVRSQPAADAKPNLTGSVLRDKTEVAQASATAPIEASEVKPQPIGRFRSSDIEDEPSDPATEEDDTLKSDPEEPAATSSDLSEAPAKPRSGRFSPRNENE